MNVIIAFLLGFLIGGMGAFIYLKTQKK